MLTSDFDFELPHDLIAQAPVEPRDQARLMVIDRQRGSWSHHVFTDLPELLLAPDVLARNNTRVIPARLRGFRAKTGGKWEGLFLRELTHRRWEILATTRGRPTLGEHVILGQNLRLVLEGRGEGGSWIVRAEQNVVTDESSYALLEQYGQIPLPPYIRHGRETPDDRLAYQTIYAQRAGSVAAPTAGLHFTDRVFAQLTAREISWVDLTLHIGVGTFRPITADCIEKHVMHPEWAELSAMAAAVLEARSGAGGRIVAVGTTVARTLETAAIGEEFQPFAGDTRLYIQPGHTVRGFDALITNFHLPRSSLLVLVSAFTGLELTRAAYRDAVLHQYRFYSFGDAMLIL